MDADGSVLRSVTPEREAHESLDEFVVLPDGSCAVWLPAERSRVVPPGGAARLARHTSDGGTLWSADRVLAGVADGSSGIGVCAAPSSSPCTTSCSSSTTRAWER